MYNIRNIHFDCANLNFGVIFYFRLEIFIPVSDILNKQNMQFQSGMFCRNPIQVFIKQCAKNVLGLQGNRASPFRKAF